MYDKDVEAIPLQLSGETDTTAHLDVEDGKSWVRASRARRRAQPARRRRRTAVRRSSRAGATCTTALPRARAASPSASRTSTPATPAALPRPHDVHFARHGDIINYNKITMKYSRTYIKQSEVGIVGHIYEHIVANQIIKALYAKGIFRLADYEIIPETFDGIVVIRFDTYSMKVLRLFEKILKSATFELVDIKLAIGQIEAEYLRKSTFDIKTLAQKLKAFHEEAWVLRKDYVITRPIAKNAGSLKSNFGGFEKNAKRQFEFHHFAYVIKDCPYELKTIATYILQIVGLIQIDGLTQRFKNSYDAGDEWAEYQDLVGYMHTLVTHKDAKISLKNLEKQFSHTLSMLNKDETFIRKIHKFITRNLEDQDQYFPLGNIFANTYQITGNAYVKKYVTEKNIAKLIELIEFDVH